MVFSGQPTHSHRPILTQFSRRVAPRMNVKDCLAINNYAAIYSVEQPLKNGLFRDCHHVCFFTLVITHLERQELEEGLDSSLCNPFFLA